MKKGTKKKRGRFAHRDACRHQVKVNGLINLADGSWGRGKDDSMRRDMFGGYKA